MINTAKNFLDMADQQLTIAGPETQVSASPNLSIEERLPIHSPLGVYVPLPEADTLGWTGPIGEHSLPEAFASVNVATGINVPHWKKMSAYCGPGAMIAVGKNSIMLNASVTLCTL